MQTMTRREWVLALAVVTGGLASAAAQGRGEALRDWVRAHVLADELKDLARAYLARYPTERAMTMEEAILAGRRADMPVAAHLSVLVRKDFETGRIEDLDGWLVSRTEARLIALATWSNP